MVIDLFRLTLQDEVREKFPKVYQQSKDARKTGETERDSQPRFYSRKMVEIWGET